MSLQWDTKARMLDNLMVAMAGAAAERQVLGEHTNGSESDFDTAVTIGMRFIKAGFGGPGLFVGEDGLPYSYLTSEWKSRSLGRIQELVAEAEVRADATIAEHLDALIIVANAVYEHCRVADERSSAVLESAGFVLPRPTAQARLRARARRRAAGVVEFPFPRRVAEASPRRCFRRVLQAPMPPPRGWRPCTRGSVLALAVRRR